MQGHKGTSVLVHPPVLCIIESFHFTFCKILGRSHYWSQLKDEVLQGLVQPRHRSSKIKTEFSMDLALNGPMTSLSPVLNTRPIPESNSDSFKGWYNVEVQSIKADNRFSLHKCK